MDEVIRALDDEDSETRREAVGVLESLDVDDLSELLIRGLGDIDWRVRKEAARVAAVRTVAEMGLGPSPIYDALVEATIQGDNVGLRNAALEVFGRVGAPAATGLLSVLPKVPTEAVKFIIEGLGHTGASSSVPALREASKSDDANIAASALDALARIGGPQAQDALKERLRATDPYQRFAALDALDRLGAEVAWPDLRPLLDDSLLRRVALRVLGRTDSVEALEPLHQALREPSMGAVRAAATSILELSRRLPAAAERAKVLSAALDLDALRRLRELLAVEENLRERRAASQLLVWARDVESLPGVLRVASEGQLTPLALSALKEWGVGAVPPLLRLTTHPDAQTSAIALEVAADLSVATAVKPSSVDGASLAPSSAQEIRRAIREASESNERPVALAAANCLALWAEAQDAPRLVRLAQRFDESVAKAAADALDALADRAPDAVRAVLSNAVLDHPSGGALVGVLARLAGRESLERVQTSLSADFPSTRASAITALSQLGGSSAVEQIALALADEEVDVQISAAVALGRLEEDREGASAHLRLALQSPHAPVRAAAARALGKLGAEDAVPALRGLVRDEAAQVALAAVEGLRRIRDSDAADAFVESLGHGDAEVVKEGLRAICASGGARAVDRVAVGLAHAAWDVRQVAANLLGELGPESVKHLERRLEVENDPLVRTALSQAIERVGTRSES